MVDSAVFGLPGREDGPTGARPGRAAPGAAVSEEALLAFLGEQLAKFKLPRSVEFIAELPREPSGKVLKRQLRDERLSASATVTTDVGSLKRTSGRVGGQRWPTT